MSRSVHRRGAEWHLQKAMMLGFSYREASFLPYGEILDHIAMHAVMNGTATCKADEESDFWNMLNRG